MRESIKFRIIPSKFDPINEWCARISPFLAWAEWLAIVSLSIGIVEPHWDALTEYTLGFVWFPVSALVLFIIGFRGLVSGYYRDTGSLLLTATNGTFLVIWVVLLLRTYFEGVEFPSL